MTSSSRRLTKVALVVVPLVLLLLGPGTMALPAAQGPTDDIASSAAGHEEECLLDPVAHKAAPELDVPPADIEATLEALHALYAGLPGFIDVYFYPADGAMFHPTFIGEVPEEARDVAADVAITLVALPQAPQPAGSGPVPSAADIVCNGIRPGARISTSGGICTLAFILASGSDLYAATAGHCVNQGGSVRIEFGGVIGKAVYSTGDGGVGDDFALIRIDPGKYHLVNPEMCSVAGPTGMHTSGGILGQPTVQTGHGGGAAGLFVTPTPPRVKHGVGFAWGARSFTWEGTTIPGDSGSAIRLVTGNALGVVTHIGIPTVMMNFGTRLDKQIPETGVPGLALEVVGYTHP